MDQLLVALDVESAAHAERLTERLAGVAGGFKIGSRLFTAEGPALVRRLRERGLRVFLDLKFHDIPNTVAEAVAEATALGVWMMTVHTSGGAAMMRAAAQAARETAARTGATPPLIVGVTVLTSLDATALAQVGVSRDLAVQVESLAALAEKAGIDGVVASPLELERLRRRHGPGFLIVTPGIRGPESAATVDDQARTLSAAGALRAGASYVVVGRPIIRAADPRAAAEQIVRSATAATTGRRPA
jgi:orotidine-5'-phosphate decarboxylase